MYSTILHSAAGRARLLALAGLVALLSTPVRAADRYDLDSVHTRVNFTVKHLWSPFTAGFKQASGAIQLDEAKPENSTVEVTIPVTSISTDNEDRDKHLRGDEFFSVEKFPNITFKSTKITKGDKKDAYKVEGNLTIRDVTKLVVLDVEWLGSGQSPWGQTVAGFSVTGAINRQDYGVKWNKALDKGGMLLGDEVKINISVEAVKAAA